MVLTSLTTQLAVGGEEEVDPRQTLAVQRLEGGDRRALDPRDDVGRQVGRDVELGAAVRHVLRLEVVERRRRPRPGSRPAATPPAGRRRARPARRTRSRGRRPPPRPAPSGRAGSACSSAASSSSGRCTFEIPMLDPPRAGLTKTGQPEVADLAPGSGVPARGRRRTAARAARPRAAAASCAACPSRPRRRTRRSRRTARRPAPAAPAACRPRRTGRAAAGRPRRPVPASAGSAVGSPGIATDVPGRPRPRAAHGPAWRAPRASVSTHRPARS